jgi:CDP-glycerol glycerophosphotransferase (TagB/SpsB family)
MFKFFKHIQNVISFNQLDSSKRQLVFYSEGKNYWVHFKGIIDELLQNHDLHICYVSSSEDDPGLKIQSSNYSTFLIDEGWVRNWFFENIEADVMVMTMPDIHQYQVKRSKHKVHYVYLQHSLVSFHMVYRKGAFDHYDSIFCSGPHHIKEIKALADQRRFEPKRLYKHGYGRLDSIIENYQTYEHKPNDPPKVLLAPSWGKSSIIELLRSQVVDLVMDAGYQLVFRPHPQTIKFAGDIVQEIVDKYKNNPLFEYENNVAGEDSLMSSDIMICDWSGAALDYAFGLNKPVVFIDVPRKVNNPDYKDIEIEPFEVSIRDKIGVIVGLDELNSLPQKIQQVLSEFKTQDLENNIYSVGQSDSVGAKFLVDIVNEQKTS